MTVPVFEDLIKQGLLEEKFRRLVTDGVSAGPRVDGSNSAIRTKR